MDFNSSDFKYKSAHLSQFKTDLDLGSKQQLIKNLEENVNTISDYQEALYAEGKQGLLVIFQGIDAAGKDSSIEKIFRGINPHGINVSSFKTPSNEEYAHDYLWRHYLKLPERGKIAVFNRSYYENVLVCRVHRSFVLNENLKNIQTEQQVTDEFFEKRYQQINHFEKNLIENGTTIIKFMLNISRKEQLNRFKERLENPKKNWKFSASDFKESELWDQYSDAFDKMLMKTSTDIAPWYVIPCDNKSTAHVIMSKIILEVFEQMNPQFPEISKEDKAINDAILKEI